MPLNRYKSNCFGSKSNEIEKLLNRHNPDRTSVQPQRKQRTKRKDDNSQTKMTKPILVTTFF